MNVRDKINQLVVEYQKSLSVIVEGEVTAGQSEETYRILEGISFYTDRLMLFKNNSTDLNQDLKNCKLS